MFLNGVVIAGVWGIVQAFHGRFLSRGICGRPPRMSLPTSDSPPERQDAGPSPGNIGPAVLRRFPISRRYYEEYVRRLNSRNHTMRDPLILDQDDAPFLDMINRSNSEPPSSSRQRGQPKIRIFIQPGGVGISTEDDDPETRLGGDDDDDSYEAYKRRSAKKSENFQVITNTSTKFRHVGGYQSVKQELMQCVDLLKNYTKYAAFNVRVPKGLILEGPPGNGKTLLAKAFAGEAGVAFVSVSGSQFQEKYVGVGSSRIRELFQLALANKPCVIFVDEIDAIGRTRASDGETASAERDSTLNELLVQMDGFEASKGIFVIAATNRADLLDPALIRPGRIDKRMFIGPPDAATRREIIDIHMKGKPHDNVSVVVDDLVDITSTLSCAQIENLLNEAMLSALREDRVVMNMTDINNVMNRIMVGWQPTEHQFSSDIIDHIAIHEMGHVVMGMMSKHHANVSKVAINLFSPQSPGYTLFQPSTTNIYTRDALFEHLMILLSGRIAEEVFYNMTVTTGAINDFEEALKLAEKMIIYYGMGKNLIYPSNSDKFREMIDDEVLGLLNDAYAYAEFVIRNCRGYIGEMAERLKRDRLLRAEDLWAVLETEPFQDLMMLKMTEKSDPM